MRNRHTYSWVFFVSMLLTLAGLACNLGNPAEATPTPAEVVAPTQLAEETAVPPPTAAPEPTAVPEAEEVTIQQLQAATVQILAKIDNRGRQQTAWTGSGTIISPNGLILTNAHVVRPSAPGLAVLYNDPELLFTREPDALVVALVERADTPPVETYRAEVLAVDGALDLAVLRIVSDLEGVPVNAASLDLPSVELGNSDAVQLGDEIQVLGFPGVGGETITFTRGDVSGFESQELVGNRAWIKTDTVVSPGNSGGLGANMVGEIVGVPSFVQEAQGGAINRLRSINLALPLIEAARENGRYQSPYIITGSGRQSFTFVTFAEDFREEDGCAINPVDAYQSGTLAAVAVFRYEGMTDGEQVLVGWFQDGELVSTTVFGWDRGAKGECFPVYVHNYGEPMPVGTYEVELYAGPALEFIATATTTVRGTAVADGGVAVQGLVTDADTGQPIPGAAVFVLQPDADLDAWVANPQVEAVFTLAETDGNGEFVLPDRLSRGTSYPGVITAEGYQPNEGGLTIEDETPDPLVLELQLSQ